MATRSIVPRSTGEGGIGTSEKHWGTAYIDNIYGLASSSGTAAYATTAGQAGTAAFATTAANAGTTSTQTDNDSTTKIASTAYAKSQDAVLARKPDQGVALTAGTSTTQITISDNTNINPGTGSFTLYWTGSVPDWTPSDDNNSLISKGTAVTDGFSLRVDQTTGKFTLRLAATIYTSSVAPSVVDNTKHNIVAVVTVGAVNTTVDFYNDGVALGAQQTAANPGSVTTAGSLYIMSSYSGSKRYASVVNGCGIFNRALTAAEVLDLYRNGIAESDKWGSQTAKMTDTASKDFTSGDATKSWNTSGSGLGLWNKRVRVQYEVTANTSNATSLTIEEDAYGPGGLFKASVTGQSVTVGVHSYEAVADYETGTGFRVDLTAVGISSGTLTIANVYLYEIGATLCLLPENAQPSPGQWIDASTNLLHAKQPATGSSLTRPKDTFTVKWTNTWAGTHEAQYIGGVNQSVLPPNCYVQSIIGVIAGSTIEDVIVGDGSDTDHWVAITTGLAAGTVNFTVANAISDGTNYKLVVDPDANFTGSIVWTIKGIVL